MKIADLVIALNLKVISGGKGLNNDFSGGYASDLLSDVMGNAGAGNIWITLQTHKNIVAVASLKELAAVILVKGNLPDETAKQKSDEENIPLLSTDDSSFRICGRLYELMIDG